MPREYPPEDAIEKMVNEDDPKLRRLLLEFKDRAPLIVSIPKDWRITFGAVATNRQGYSVNADTLRVYEAKDKQRAAFTNVINFRDLSIECQDGSNELLVAVAGALAKGAGSARGGKF